MKTKENKDFKNVLTSAKQTVDNNIVTYQTNNGRYSLPVGEVIREFKKEPVTDNYGRNKNKVIQELMNIIYTVQDVRDSFIIFMTKKDDVYLHNRGKLATSLCKVSKLAYSYYGNFEFSRDLEQQFNYIFSTLPPKYKVLSK